MLELERFYESPMYYGVITNDSKVYRICKRSRKEQLCKIYEHKGKAEVSVGGKKFIVKHLLAQYFLTGYEKGKAVKCIDGNEFNLTLDNLLIYDKKQLGKITGCLSHNICVIITYPNGQKCKYESIRKAAKALHCSYQTLLDYMRGKVKNSVLEGIKIKTISSKEDKI